MQALSAILAEPALCGYPADHIRLAPSTSDLRLGASLA